MLTDRVRPGVEAAPWGAEWVPYTDEEQAAWAISVTKIADKALEKLS